MDFRDVLIDAFGRIHDATHGVVEGCSDAVLTFRADAGANSIAWLVWHLTRIQDDHVADVAGTDQVWTADGWHERFALPFDVSATGYGQTSDEVAVVTASAELLLGYHDAVHDETVRFVRGLEAGDLDRIVDERWDPPVTLAVRLVSVVADDLEHAGQAAFVLGLAQRISVDS